jgi:hypothetical protein
MSLHAMLNLKQIAGPLGDVLQLDSSGPDGPAKAGHYDCLYGLTD